MKPVKTLLLTLLFTSCFLPGLILAQDSKLGDHEALMALYEATNGNNWTNNTGWVGSTPETMGHMYGVTVWDSGPNAGRVKEIDLMSNNLVGTISTVPFQNLRYCEVLVLKQPRMSSTGENEPRLTGDLPSQIGYMQSLKWLSLSGQNVIISLDRGAINEWNHVGGSGKQYRDQNEFGGSLPPEWGNLSNLELLELRRNSLSGGVPVEWQEMTSLIGLFLNHNGLTGEAPEFPNSPNLAHYRIPFNSFTGELPSSLNQNTKMAHFVVRDNQLSGTVPVYDGWTDLRVYNIGNNVLSRFPIEIFQGDRNPLLLYFYGGGNPINDRLDKYVIDPSKHNIAIFGLSSAGMYGSVPNWLTEMRPIQLFLQRNDFSGDLPAGFHDIQIISDTGLSGTSNTLTYDLGSKIDFEGLSPRTVYISITGGYGEGQQKEILSQSGNTFTIDGQWDRDDSSGEALIPDGSSEFVIYASSPIYDKLRLLFMNNQDEGDGSGGFTGPLPQANLGPDIAFMSFSKSKFTGSIPWQWGLTRSRRDLEITITNNQLTGAIPTSLLKIFDLSQLDISNNSFTAQQIQDFQAAIDASGSTIEFIFNNQNTDNSGGDGSTDNPPTTPSPSTPADGATGVSVTPSFQWGIMDAESYDIEVQDLSSSSTVINTSVINTSFTPSNILEYSTSYRWRIRSVRDGLQSTWSSYSGFTTEEDPNSGDGGSTAPVAPALLSPSDGSGNVTLTPQFTWGSVDADYYILHVSGSKPSEMVIEEQLSDTSFTSSVSLSEGRDHQWRVRGVKDGVEGNWSPIRSFTTLDNSGNNGKGPQKITPAKDEKNVSKRKNFKWETMEEAEAYEIEITSLDEQTIVIDEIVTDTTYTPGQDFQPNHQYKWRVRAYIDGQAMEWSEAWAFTTGEDVMVTEVELEQNYPNPFNPTTNIRFNITQQQEVTLKVYDMTGRLVASLLSGEQLGAGPYNVTFNANSLASGIYFYRIITPTEIITRKMTLLK